jgi:hypothetical protein
VWVNFLLVILKFLFVEIYFELVLEKFATSDNRKKGNANRCPRELIKDMKKETI